MVLSNTPLKIKNLRQIKHQTNKQTEILNINKEERKTALLPFLVELRVDQQKPVYTCLATTHPATGIN